MRKQRMDKDPTDTIRKEAEQLYLRYTRYQLRENGLSFELVWIDPEAKELYDVITRDIARENLREMERTFANGFYFGGIVKDEAKLPLLNKDTFCILSNPVHEDTFRELYLDCLGQIPDWLVETVPGEWKGTEEGEG